MNFLTNFERSELCDADEFKFIYFPRYGKWRGLYPARTARGDSKSDGKMNLAFGLVLSDLQFRLLFCAELRARSLKGKNTHLAIRVCFY